MTYHRHHPLRSPRAHGFTLIEVLIAGLICSLLLGSLCGLMFGALRLREKTYENSESGPPRDQVIQMIRRDLMNAVVPNGTLAGPFSGVPNAGSGAEQDTLSFFTTTGLMNDTDPWSEIQKVDYYLQAPTGQNAAAGSDLIRRTTRNLLATEVTQEADDNGQWTLLRGVKTLKISYWDGQNEQWINYWDSTSVSSANPVAIRFRVEFANPPDAKRTDPPLELVCAVTPQPVSSTTTASTGAGA